MALRTVSQPPKERRCRRLLSTAIFIPAVDLLPLQIPIEICRVVAVRSRPAELTDERINEVKRIAEKGK